eukprot:3094738-Prorocentrum_lima.AAC.1
MFGSRVHRSCINCELLCKRDECEHWPDAGEDEIGQNDATRGQVPRGRERTNRGEDAWDATGENNLKES